MKQFHRKNRRFKHYDTKSPTSQQTRGFPFHRTISHAGPNQQLNACDLQIV